MCSHSIHTKLRIDQAPLQHLQDVQDVHSAIVLDGLCFLRGMLKVKTEIGDILYIKSSAYVDKLKMILTGFSPSPHLPQVKWTQ